MIKIYKTPDLPVDIQNQIAVCIDNEFGHIPIVKETEWAKPDWTILCDPKQINLNGLPW
jgi:hypothetical protein